MAFIRHFLLAPSFSAIPRGLEFVRQSLSAKIQDTRIRMPTRGRLDLYIGSEPQEVGGDPQGLLEFLRLHRLAIEASVSAAGAPQAAVVGFAITDQFEIVFDTLESTRKAQNLRGHPKIAFVIGGMVGVDERTVQYEGVADEPSGAELDRLKKVYYAAYPDGPSRLSWSGLIYVRARPTWVRYSDYNRNPPEIVEFRAEQLIVRVGKF